MPVARRLCFDRVLPQDLLRQQQVEATPDGGSRAIAPRKQWVNGSSIRITFIGGTEAQRKLVREVADEWTQHANLTFVWVDDPKATIRVSFDEDDGAWSYVGTDNRGIPLDQATLNLGWVDRAVILHEFGHMIGLAHEHQNPDGGIEWDEDVVIAELGGPPNNWSPATTRHNVLNKYSVSQLRDGTKFDPDSIMLYAFPGEWTKNRPEGTKENNDLSAMDKAFVAGALMYPGRPKPEARAIELPVWKSKADQISKAGEEDLFKFVLGNAGTYVIETDGTTDVMLSLFGPDDLTVLVAKDNDSGFGKNAHLRRDLAPGTYYAAVRHRAATKTGPYAIRVYSAV